MRRTVSVLGLLVATVAALAFTPSTAQAQWRHGHSAVVVGGGYFYDPFFWDPFWYPYYPPYYGAWYPPYPYAYRYTDDASIRLEVKPKQAQVYVDGYYAGLVDDFDGVFQRLHVDPGEHDLVIYLEGYRSAHEHLSLAANHSYKVKYTLEKLAPGAPNEPKPVPTQPPPQPNEQGPQTAQPPNRVPYGPRTGPPMPPMPPGPPNAPPEQPRTSASRDYGVLAIRVQPPDAEVLIDNEVWRGPEGEERLLVQVADGMHHVEIRKEGRRTFSTDVMVHAGETVPLNVSLAPGDER